MKEAEQRLIVRALDEDRDCAARQAADGPRAARGEGGRTSSDAEQIKLRLAELPPAAWPAGNADGSGQRLIAA
jgi:hypothetical protein